MLARVGYCNPTKPKLYKTIGKGNTVIFFLRIKSYSISSFTRLYDLFYPSRTISHLYTSCGADINNKVIPVNLHEYITPLTLATLFLSSVWEEKSLLYPQAKLDPSYLEYSVVKGLKSLSVFIRNEYKIESEVKINEGFSLGSLHIKNPSVFASVIKPYILPSQVNLLNRPSIKLKFFERNQFKRFLTLSHTRSLSTNLLGNSKDVTVRENKLFITATDISNKLTKADCKDLTSPPAVVRGGGEGFIE